MQVYFIFVVPSCSEVKDKFLLIYIWMSIDIAMATNISEEEQKLLTAFKSLQVAPKANGPKDSYMAM